MVRFWFRFGVWFLRKFRVRVRVSLRVELR